MERIYVDGKVSGKQPLHHGPDEEAKKNTLS